MAAFDYSRAPAVSSVLAGRVATKAYDFIGALLDWNDARMTRKALGALSDRELDDIGLHRGDIDIVADNPRARF